MMCEFKSWRPKRTIFSQNLIGTGGKLRRFLELWVLRVVVMMMGQISVF